MKQRYQIWPSENEPIVVRRDAKARGLPHYFTGKPCVHGHMALRLTSDDACRGCFAAKHRWWVTSSKHVSGDHFRAERRAYWNTKPAVKMFLGVRSRAKKRGIEITITADDIVIPDNCPCCGQRLEVRTGPLKQGQVPTSPSLDRIDSRRGYVPDNIAVICWRCNEVKRNASAEELRMVAAWMERMNTRHDPYLRLVG